MFSSSFETFVSSNTSMQPTICITDEIKDTSNLMKRDGYDYYKNFITGEIIYFSYIQSNWKNPKDAKKLEYLMSNE